MIFRAANSMLPPLMFPMSTYLPLNRTMSNPSSVAAAMPYDFHHHISTNHHRSIL